MKIFKYGVILFFLIMAVGCKKSEVLEKPKNDVPGDVVFNIVSEVPVHSVQRLEDVITETNMDIVSENFLINTTELGEIKYTVDYLYNEKKYSYKFTIAVTDKENPIIFGSTTQTSIIGKEYDLCSAINYGDNHDSDPKCEITGNYDFNTLGEYKLKMNVTDSSGNATEKEVKLNIINPSTSNGGSSSTTKRIEFSDVMAKYGDENTEFGIDISSWQENVGFTKVKEAGATFVMIRLGFQKGINGELKIDSYYDQNIAGAKAAGLKVGVYLYTDAGSVKEAKEHALWMVEKLDKTKLDLPVVFDWENWSNFNKYRISFNDLNEIADTFLETIEENGYKAMLYGSKYYLETFWKNKNNYPIWLAHYTEKTSYKEKYLMWQLCNTGKINGIAGPVDINIMYND